MLEVLFIAGSIFIPLVFGLVPAFLPRRVPNAVRWILWLAVIAFTGWYVHLIREAPSPYPLMALIFLIISAALSLIVLLVETSRARATARRH